MFSPTWTVGQQPISGYELKRCIGKGTFGEVWEAKGPDGLSIALKRVSLEKAFHREAEDLATLNPSEDDRNPSLLSIRQKWIIDDSFIIGYALSDTGLSQPIKATTHLQLEIAPTAEANPLFTNAADALDYFCTSIRRLRATPSPLPSVFEKLKRVRKTGPFANYAPKPLSPFPFIVGIMGDFVGHSSRKPEPLEHRKFIPIDHDNFNDVMRDIAPELQLRVVNKLVYGGDPITVQLRFQSMQDFQPAFVALQVAPLRMLLAKRAKIAKLKSLADRGLEPGADQSKFELPFPVSELMHELFPGGALWNEELIDRLSTEIASIDTVLSGQLAAIMHTAEFQKLEGSWRGLQYLVYNSESGTQLQLKVLNLTKRELYEDLNPGRDPSQSQFYDKIYSRTFAVLGGWPFGAIIGDYEFQNHPDDIALLRNLSVVAAASFCPIIASVGCEMFGFDSWEELKNPWDIVKIFDTPSYASWNGFRESEDSRFVVLTMPRSLARLPYGTNTKPIDEFGFEEVPLGADGALKDYCWMSTAYVMGARLTESIAKYGWCTRIRGVEGGGKVDNLPVHVARTTNGDLEIKGSTEVLILDGPEKQISDCGFLPLCHFKEMDFAVFFSLTSTQNPKRYEGEGGDEATMNAAIVSRLPYTLITSRIAHFIKVMARDKIGSFMNREDCEVWFNNWITEYRTASSRPSAEEKATHPLADARIEVLEISGQPGEYNVVAWLRPWLPFEELSQSIRLVIRLPSENCSDAHFQPF
jgi:type VI secretion system protein ImpC